MSALSTPPGFTLEHPYEDDPDRAVLRSESGFVSIHFVSRVARLGISWSGRSQVAPIFGRGWRQALVDAAVDLLRRPSP